MPLILRLLEPIFNLTVLLLKKYQQRTGVLPLRYWHLIVRLAPVAAVELIVSRGEGADREILLLRRSSMDPIWPSQMHFPGSVIRNNHDSLEDAFKRVAGEIGLTSFSSPPEFAGIDICPSERNQVVSICYIHKADDFVPSVGGFYRCDSLPDDMIKYQIGQLARLGLIS